MREEMEAGGRPSPNPLPSTGEGTHLCVMISQWLQMEAGGKTLPLPSPEYRRGDASARHDFAVVADGSGRKDPHPTLSRVQERGRTYAS
jgi:hypothetical protein